MFVVYSDRTHLLFQEVGYRKVFCQILRYSMCWPELENWATPHNQKGSFLYIVSFFVQVWSKYTHWLTLYSAEN